MHFLGMTWRKRSARLLRRLRSNIEEGKEADAKEALRNIEIAAVEAAPNFNVFIHLRQLQQSWERMMDFAGQAAPREKIRQTLLAT